MPRTYYVYILASKSRVLYIGVTGNLLRRLHEHRAAQRPGFTSRYRVTKLVYFESTADVRAAIAREKELKGWSRRRKVELIEHTNAGWLDLASDWLPGCAG